MGYGVSRKMFSCTPGLSSMFTYSPEYMTKMHVKYLVDRPFIFFAVRRLIAGRHDKKVLELYGAASMVNFPLSALVDPATTRVHCLRTSNGREIPLAPEKTKVHAPGISRSTVPHLAHLDDILSVVK